MKENSIGLAIHYVNHRVQQKDMHWTVTLKVQGWGVDKENLERTSEWELQKAGES